MSSEPANGYRGTRLLYTAMVPAEEAEESLARPGGFGHGVSHLRGQTLYESGSTFPATSFWVESRRPDHKRYQALVEAWTVHDRHVLQPFAGILQHYGLSPRVLSDQTITWDDLSVPSFEVVRVSPLSVYKMPELSTARVEILRDYLEDYLLHHECVALATQWEERFSTGDPAFEAAVGKFRGSQHRAQRQGDMA